MLKNAYPAKARSRLITSKVGYPVLKLNPIIQRSIGKILNICDGTVKKIVKSDLNLIQKHDVRHLVRKKFSQLKTICRH